MSAFSDYLEDALLNATLRGTAYTSPASVYLALFVSDPTDAGTGTEVSGGSYARQAVAFNAPSGGTCLNSAQVTYPTASAAWGTVTHFGIYDAVSGGNLLYHGPLNTSKTINSGDTPSFGAGQLSLSLS